MFTGNLYTKIVSGILPKFATNLKEEGLISNYDRNPFKIRLHEDFPPFEIRPDLVLSVSNGKRVLVEVVNPKDPKRFFGELIYPHILGSKKQIACALFFILPHDNTFKGIHKERMDLGRVIREFIKMTITHVMASWAPNETVNYDNLKSFLQDMVNLGVI